MFEIKVPDQHVPKLKEAYEGIYKEFMTRWNDLMAEWKELQPILIQFNIIQPATEDSSTSAKDQIHPDSNGYDPNWTWMQKSVYILNKAGKPLTSKEIIDAIDELEPGISIAKLVNSVPATLSVAAGQGKLIRSKLQNGEYAYTVREGGQMS